MSVVALALVAAALGQCRWWRWHWRRRRWVRVGGVAGAGGAGSVGASGHEKASRGFEPRSLDSGSRVLTVTPRGPYRERRGGKTRTTRKLNSKPARARREKPHRNTNVRPEGAYFREQLLAEGCGRRGSQCEHKAAHRNTAQRGQSGASKCTRSCPLSGAAFCKVSSRSSDSSSS